jgi:diamine N-acetyltransferase
MTDIRQVLEPSDVGTIAALARAIWSHHYVPIIGQAQTRYMLEQFQSPAAILRQITEGYQYYLALADSAPAGYLAIVPNPAERRAQLSKLYVQHEQRRSGLGGAMVAFAEQRCADGGLDELWLTVNRHNVDAIAFYTKVGFAITGKLVQDIGGGFVMDDYRMAKKLIRGRA